MACRKYISASAQLKHRYTSHTYGGTTHGGTTHGGTTRGGTTHGGTTHGGTTHSGTTCGGTATLSMAYRKYLSASAQLKQQTDHIHMVAIYGNHYF